MSRQMFDVPKIVEHFGGRTDLHNKLKDVGYTITVRGIDQWLYRGRIPADALAAMLALSVLSGDALDLSKYTKQTDQQRRPEPREPIDSLLD